MYMKMRADGNAIFAEQLPQIEVGYTSGYRYRWNNEMVVHHREIDEMTVYDLRFTGSSHSVAEIELPAASLVLHISIDGPIKYDLDGKKVVVHERGLSLYYLPQGKVRLHLGDIDNHSMLLLLPIHALEPYARILLPAACLIEQLQIREQAALLPNSLPAPYELIRAVQEAATQPSAKPASLLMETFVDQALCHLLITTTARPPFLNEEQVDQIYMARDAIRGSLHHHLNAAELEKLTGLSEWKLRTWFPMVFGVPAGEYAIEHRMDEACKMLVKGEKLSYIAHKLGYSCAKTFRHTFRRHFGLIPSAFAEDMRRQDKPRNTSFDASVRISGAFYL